MNIPFCGMLFALSKARVAKHLLYNSLSLSSPVVVVAEDDYIHKKKRGASSFGGCCCFGVGVKLLVFFGP